MTTFEFEKIDRREDRFLNEWFGRNKDREMPGFIDAIRWADNNPSEDTINRILALHNEFKKKKLNNVLESEFILFKLNGND